MRVRVLNLPPLAEMTSAVPSQLLPTKIDLPLAVARAGLRGIRDVRERIGRRSVGGEARRQDPRLGVLAPASAATRITAIASAARPASSVTVRTAPLLVLSDSIGRNRTATRRAARQVTAGSSRRRSRPGATLGRP